MNKNKFKLQCERCGLEHELEINYSDLNQQQKSGREPVVTNFICDRIAVMYKVVNFGIDTTVNSLNIPHLQGQTESQLKTKYGEADFQCKLKRLKELNFVFLGGPDEYFDLISQIKNSYCMGYFYPTITAAGALGERIINELVLKTRSYHKTSKHYKKIYNKKSFDNWEDVSDILYDWGVTSDSVRTLFKKLYKIRNDAIHYNHSYDFQNNALIAIETLIKIINQQFSYFERKDLCWLFDRPGEIFVKSEKLKDPFVIEFILPHCVLISPYDEPTSRPSVKAKNVPLKPLSDTEFLELRKNRNKIQ